MSSGESSSVGFIRLEDVAASRDRTLSSSSFISTLSFKYKTRNALFCIPVFVIVLATIIFVIVIYGQNGFATERPEIASNETQLGRLYSKGGAARSEPPSKNVLLIVIDDLRPALSCYDDPMAITPNIDQLAARGFIFRNAYAQQALCAPSRTSLLTSRRPDSTRLYDTESYWRDFAGNFTTLPQHFKDNGYHTVSVGKVFHKGIASNYTDDYPYSWTEVPFHPLTDKYKMAKTCPTVDGLRANLICPVEVKSQPLGTLPDFESTKYSCQFLRDYAANHNRYEKQPFFLAVGYHKPHIPFKFPKEFLDLYPISSVTLAPNPTLPAKLPPIAWAPWTDVRSRNDISQRNLSFPYGLLPEDLQKLSRQGYYASVSFIDDLIGHMLQVLEETHLANNTIVVLFGDHGWSLGEHQEWAKYSNFEVALRVPLIISAPPHCRGSLFRPFEHIAPSRRSKECLAREGRAIDALVELVDVFPTVAELAGLEKPPLCPQGESLTLCTEGVSLVPLMTTRDPPIPWKSAAFAQYPRPSALPQRNSDSPKLADIRFMGYTIRTQRFRYTEWVEFDPVALAPNWSRVSARELYRHDLDPLENENLDGQPQYHKVLLRMSRELHRGWRDALPGRPSFDSTGRT